MKGSERISQRLLIDAPGDLMEPAVPPDSESNTQTGLWMGVEKK